MGCDFLALVAEKILAILQADARCAKASSESVAQVVQADALESLRCCYTELSLVAF